MKETFVVIIQNEHPTPEEKAKAEDVYGHSAKIANFIPNVILRGRGEERLDFEQVLNLSGNKDFDRIYKDVLVGVQAVEAEPAVEVVEEAVEALKEEAPAPKAPAKKPAAKKTPTRRNTKAKTEE